MEAEEEWNKNRSAPTLLDKKVPCKQNGRTGKTDDSHAFNPTLPQSSGVGLSI